MEVHSIHDQDDCRRRGRHLPAAPAGACRQRSGSGRAPGRGRARLAGRRQRRRRSSRAAGRPVDPAFVEALHKPSGWSVRPAAQPGHGADGRRAPGAAAGRRAAAAYDLRSLRRLTPVRDQGGWGTCWAFANLAAVESRLLPGKPWDFSEDNLVTRSGYGPFAAGAIPGAAATSWRSPTSPAGPGPSTRAATGTTRPKPPKPQRDAQARAGRRHAARTRRLPRQRPPQADGHRERRRQRGHVLGARVLLAGLQRHEYAPDRHLLLRPRCRRGVQRLRDQREPRRRHRRLGRHLPATLFSGSARARRRATAPSSRATAGARAGATAATSGSRTTTARSPSPTARATHAWNPSRLQPQLPVRHPRVDQVPEFPDVPDPSVAWAANRFTAKGDEPIVAEGFYAPAAGTDYQCGPARPSTP